uniref:D-isomer specific 2-hydroxyacid dehydrogenase catalytic domain-containing protein n=1 Tax=Octopus bimaculoides TaxID=37653 RepID=A0A0L8HL79_OCTBM
MALVVNFCEHFYEKLPDLKSFFFNVVFRAQNVVTLKELEQNPSLCEKVVGLYVNSDLNRNQEFLELLEKLVNLKIISFLGIGFDSVDTEWAKSRDIRIGHSTQDGVTAANFGMTLLLAMSRKIVQCK